MGKAVKDGVSYLKLWDMAKKPFKMCSDFLKLEERDKEMTALPIRMHIKISRPKPCLVSLPGL